MTYTLFRVNGQTIETAEEIEAQQKDFISDMQDEGMDEDSIEKSIEEWDELCKEIVKVGKRWRLADYEGGDWLDANENKLANEKVREISMA
ncbi:hypothetical protein [Acidithiobacillus sp.]|jgi:hypothetical protein|uniref:hypothetical protein n=1 Tax=Acidithiobacillus sp. TaxID=1872118 RepID=UPI00230B6025|nr:hypothetical protein [Acidithiobacillus sp.]MDA8247525.1 hypothetical protein [Acidithiobacillus sp.]